MSEVDSSRVKGGSGSSADKSGPLLVAAIDFGTTFSGYAFSFVHDFKKEPLKINSHPFVAGARGLMSLKTATCVLFDKNKKFQAFGFEAEDMYGDLALEGEHEDYYFFRRFKMELFGKMKVKRSFDLVDVTGKTMPAIDVFSACIRYLKDHLVDTCKKRVSGVGDDDIRWVLTVPAIWDDKAKQFMREAALKADIKSNKMVIALEPEAASIFCRYLPVENFCGATDGPKPFKIGSKYLVLDAGGGTIDITVHQVMSNGSLKELHKAEGGDWGGTMVDQAFVSLLEKIVSKDVMDDFLKNHTSDFMDIIREFEVKKRNFKEEMAAKTTFKVPIVVSEIHSQKKKKDIKSALGENSAYSGKITWVGDKLRVDSSIAKGLFENACRNIVAQLKALFKEPDLEDVPTILMVGGFSESNMLQEYIKKNFKDKKIIIPQEAGLAVLKGAVIFGHDLNAITSRKCKFTYGVKTSRAFDPKIHPLAKKYENDAGKELCDDIFDSHVNIGDEVQIGERKGKSSYKPTKANQKSIVFSIYGSKVRSPMYVTDEGCFLLGTLTVELGGSGLNRSATIELCFGGTELEVIGTNQNGEETKATFDFLD